jgi:molybdenum cofactor guanylyltransferase
VDEISAYILAGGKSSRMGSDKAFLELGGRTLLVRALELAKSIAERVKIVGDPKRFAAFGSVIGDVFPDRGPLGGIHAALADSETPLNLILGVDLPFLDTPLLNYLIKQAAASNVIVTVPRVGDYYQTLCAIYSKEFALVAERALEEGKNKIDLLFSKLSVRLVDEPELADAGFDATFFRNLNTPDDWGEARRTLDSQPSIYDELDRGKTR